MDITQVAAIREDMERMEAHKLQPHFIEAFFLEALQNLGGRFRQREKGRYEITFVPYSIRNQNIQTSFCEPVLQRYERVCFEKGLCNIQGQTPATLIAPGHPLLEAIICLILERNTGVLRYGAVFIDEISNGSDARLLFYLESSVQDGIVVSSGKKRVVSKQIHFVEIDESGLASNAGYAPYLDYRAASPDELIAMRGFLESQWLRSDIDDIAIGYAISQIVPSHVLEVRERKTKLIDKTIKAVKERLTAEIQHWDFKAAELKMKEATGKTNAKINSQLATRRAEELEARLQKRIAELEAERLISAMPPVVIGGAIVIPRGLLDKLTGRSNAIIVDALARREIEIAAMKAVMDIEISLGNTPTDVSAKKVGYDIESLIPLDKRGNDGAPLRFIEIKGRVKGAGTVTVSKNEILTAFNKPDGYILAIVEVDGVETNTTYLTKPFQKPPDFAATSVNYSIDELIDSSEILLKR